MQFRRSGQRDERRRRILREEVAAAKAEEQASKTTSRSSAKRIDLSDMSRNYTDEALAEQQERITDFVPTKGWKLALWVLSSLAVIATLDSLYFHFFLKSDSASSPYLEAFDLEKSSSLGAWFCSMLLAVGAVGSVLIYKLRRHKIDDFRGRYRLWFWISAALLLAASDATTQWRRSISGLMSWLTGATLDGDGEIWWMLVLGSAAGVLGVRLLLEVRESRLALSSLIIATLGYLLTAAMKLDFISPGLLGPAVLVQATAAMLSHTALFFTVVFYARYVYLDSQGMLCVQRPLAEDSVKSNNRRLRAAKKTTLHIEDVKTTSRKRTDLEPSSERPHTKQTPKSKPAPKPIETSLGQLEKEDDSVKKLSKAERRRLRKQMRKEMRQNRESDAA